MSLFCPMAGCKAKSGMCNCEKIMSIVILAVIVFFLYRHFAA